MKKQEHELMVLDDSRLSPAEKSVHNNFTTSVGALRKDLVRTAYYLLQIQERMIHKKMGFADLPAYAACYAGLTARQTREFVVIARRLPRFQEVETALNEGRLSWSQARLITRRAEPEQQQRWITEAQLISVKELETRLPATHGRGPSDSRDEKSLFAATAAQQPPVPPAGSLSSPQARPNPLAADKKQFFTLSFTGEQYALFSTLLAAAQGGSKEEKILAALAAAGGQGASAVPYLLVIMQCPDCGDAAIPTNRGEIPVSRALLQAAYCDAAIEDAAGTRRQTIPPRLRRQALQRARFRCEAPGCSHTQFLQLHHRLPAANGGGNNLDNLIVLCSRCHRRLHSDEEAARQALRNVPV